MSRLMPYKKLMPGDKKSTGNETAIDLIYNFLNEPALRGFSGTTIGGTFPLTNFQLAPGSCAKQFWYCLDETRAPREVYVAIEDSNIPWPRNRRTSEIPKTPETSILFRPNQPFTFDDDNFDRTDIAQVDQFIREHRDSNDGVRSVSRDNVESFGRAFIKSFGGKKDKREFCYYPLAHFENFTPETGQHVIDNFLKIGDVHYIRYYFGLETSPGHGANRIRIVLFPIGKDQARIKGQGTNDVLQFSWPPDDKCLFSTCTTKERNIDKRERKGSFLEKQTAVVI